MSKTITLETAGSELNELIRSLEPGDEIVVTANDRIVARISPDESKSGVAGQRTFGAWKGKLIEISDDDEHLKDFEDYM